MTCERLSFRKAGLGLLAGAVLVVSASDAQVPVSNACATQFGVCYVGYAPVGTYCRCGGDPGRIVLQRWSDACGTHRGVCRVPPGPVGTPCGCYGDPGRRL